MPAPLILETIDVDGDPLLIFVGHVTFVQRTTRRNKDLVVVECACVYVPGGAVTVPYSVEEFARKVAALT